MIDIHTHVLNGVDDGAPDSETTHALLRMAAERGTTDLICTPHVLEAGRDLNWQTITGQVEKLSAWVQEQALPLRLYAGAELEMNFELTQILKADQADYCLAGSRYVLIELPALSLPVYMDDFLYELELKELVPVLAHPERHQGLMHHLEKLQTWLERGVLLQMNGGSLTGLFGPQVQQNARMLIQNKAVAFIGSDAHRVHRRHTDLTAAKAAIEKLAGAEYARQILETNPRQLLQKEKVNWQPPQTLTANEEAPKKSWWHRFFS